MSFDRSGLETRCHGTGRLECLCGGDLCLCDHQGSAECYGCLDCEGDPGEEYECKEGPYDDGEPVADRAERLADRHLRDDGTERGRR